MNVPATPPQLHPELTALLTAPAPGPQTVHEARAGLLTRYGSLPRPEVAYVKDLAIDGSRGPIKLRVYGPGNEGPSPVLVFFHGGGFVLGSVETHDALCRAICLGAGVVVVSVDYALAPEHPFPAGLEDCIAALRWVAQHAETIGGNPRKLVLGGDSAGANLAVVSALQCLKSGGPALAALLLAYPVVDAPDRSRPSYVERGEGFGLTAAAMDFFFAQYLDDPALAHDPRVSPLRSEDLSALPSIWLLTAEFDPLRDEGIAFAQALGGAGVAVEHVHFHDANHGFLAWAGTNEPSARGLSTACEWLKGQLA